MNDYQPQPVPCTYQLHICLAAPLSIAVGALGEFEFPVGEYIYTGSAKRNIEARIARHLRQEKKLHWHIDYLLLAPGVTVTAVIRSNSGECLLNQTTSGEIPAPGFGASDCRHGCGSHLKYLGEKSALCDCEWVTRREIDHTAAYR